MESGRIGAYFVTSPPPVIAVVDDEASLRKALGRLLRLHDCKVVPYESGDDFLARREEEAIDCVLLDLHLTGTADGFGVLDALRAVRVRPAVIVMTGHDQAGYERRVRELGASSYLLKPIDETRLMDAIREAIADPGSREGSVG